MKNRKKTSTTKSVRGGRKDPTYGGLLHVTARAKSAPVGDGMTLAAVWVVAGLCLLIAGWGLWMLAGGMGRLLFSNNPRFNLTTVEARTDGVLPEALLVEWAGVPREANLFQISLPTVRDRLEKNPIIRQAVVRRRLPGTLEIGVNERVPIARMGQVEGHMNWLVDVEGVLIRKSFQDKHLPFLLGVPQNVTLGDTIAQGRAADGLEYLARLREMPALKRDLFDVRMISVGHPDYLDARLSDGSKVLLPRGEDARRVLEEATRMIDLARRQQRELTYFDLRPRGENRIGAPR
ncbi:MAG: FtsQ-type POTRA domain-containing protein [Verrucomicrobia bacterium]|nr:FtsQ-type POTRA domain-containing protein [Verrucomicrobiota bacterium]